MQYKKDLNQMSEKDELAYLARLEQRYKNNGEIVSVKQPPPCRQDEG
jgi:hypothetical protein